MTVGTAGTSSTRAARRTDVAPPAPLAHDSGGPGRRPYRRRGPRVTLAVLAAAGLLLAPAVAPAAVAAATGPRLDDDSQCDFPVKDIKGTPWALQRVLLNQLWQHTKGQGVEVAVVDSGVDIKNPQLTGAVDVLAGSSVVGDEKGHGTTDTIGHGTKVAGIIAARPVKSTGFVGLAPEAKIVPIKQYEGDEDVTGSGKTNNDKLAAAVNAAADAGVQIINISQDIGSRSDPAVAAAVQRAVSKGILVVAAAGNDGANGRPGTVYPAAYRGVLAVGASDRNNERADFSQVGSFVDVAAPGVDMVSTVPKGGQCVDSGTSFSAPYVAAVAALIKSAHWDWTPQQISTRIEQTAQRTSLGRNDFVGWGVVDPVRAVSDSSMPSSAPTPDKGLAKSSSRVIPATLTLGESRQAHDRRIATYVVGAALLAVMVVAGVAVAMRDLRRKPGAGARSL